LVTANKSSYTSIDSGIDTAIPEALIYAISGSGTTFTATRNNVPFITTGKAIQPVIDDIRTDSAGADCIIRFGDGDTALDIGTATVSLNNTGGTWGLIELAGKITGSVNTATTGTIAIADAVSVTSIADIANTNASTGTSANGRAIYYNSTGTLHTSGGKVSANTGVAVFNASTGKITVSGSADISSASRTNTGGTIYLAVPTTDNTNLRLEISGGTVSNTYSSSAARVINNLSTGAVIISGGEVKATQNDTYAIYNNASGALTISGGTVSTTSGRAVHNQVTGVVTISGGEVKTSGGRAIHNEATGPINISGGTVSGSVYNNATGSINISGGEISATAAINNTSGAVNISGGTVSGGANYAVSTTTGKITVSQAAGAITLVTSAYPYGGGTILINSGGSATDVLLEITGGTVQNTNTTTTVNNSINAIRNKSAGIVKISGGTVQVTHNSNYAYAVHNESTGTIDISGGTVSGPNGGRAILNEAAGVINISGGEVSARYNAAISNESTGTVNISGGTVLGGSNTAVWNRSTGKITVSGTAKVTSAYSSTTTGTIYITNSGTATDERLVITGGTVENTSTTTGNAINNASTGAVTISGGTVSKAGTSGNAINNNSTGVVTITKPPAVIIGNVTGVPGYTP